MTRSLAIVFALFVTGAAAYVVVRGRTMTAAPTPPVTAPAVVSDAPAGGSASPVGGAAPARAADDAAPPSGDPAASAQGDAAPLASGAPRQVIFGVALIWYRGAQSAPVDARSKEDATKLATSIAEQAKKDFAGALERADSGFENAGSIQQSVLEAPAEAVLFSLGVGEVGGPVDSPRGFYVFRRIE